MKYKKPIFNKGRFENENLTIYVTKTKQKCQ